MAADVVITISGNATSLTAAAQEAIESLRAVGAQVTQTSAQVADSSTMAGNYGDVLAGLTGTLADLDDAAAGNADAIAALSTSYQLAAETAGYLADAGAVMSAEQIEQAQAFLTSATSAEEYATRLRMLQAQLALVREQQEATAASGGAFGGILGGLSETVSGFVSQATSMFVAMAGWQVFNDAANAVRNLADELFNLEVTTEKNVNAWQYLFGSKQAATGLAQWTSQFSMQVPFTRQDLIAATSTMGSMAGASQVEQFMPTLADLASTLGATAYGGQGLTLQQAAQAVIDFMMGRSMMLKQELKINPADLLKYGMQGDVTGMGVHLSDPMSVLTALEGYSQARGLSGAAAETATSTWWGEWSSFQDRIQNFLLQAGGTNLAGTIRPGSLFADLKTQLDDLSHWIDSHSGQISKLADTISKDLGGAFASAAKDAQGLLTGLRQSGLFAGLGFGPQAPGGAPATVFQHGGHGQRGSLASSDVGLGGGGPIAMPQLSGWAQAGQTIGGALQAIGNAAHTAGTAIKDFTGFVESNGTKIKVAAGLIAAFYTPALIASGVQATIAAARITASFIASMVKTGIEGWAAAGKVTIFIGSEIAAGAQAVANAAKVTASFIASMVQSGAEAVANGAKVVASFVASMVTAGAQAVASAAKITASFIASLIETGARAVATGAMMLASLVPAAIATTANFVIMAATGIASAIVGFIAYIPVALAAAAATIAATWPVLLIIAAIAALIAVIVLVVTHWHQISDAVMRFWNSGMAAKAIIIALLGPIGLMIAAVVLVKNHWTEITTALGHFKDLVVTGVITAWKGLGDAVSGVWSGIQSAVKNGIDWVIDRLNDFIRLLNNLQIHVPQVNIGGHTVGGGTIGFPHISPIPRLASGGEVEQEGLAWVGEKGPELRWLGAGTRVFSHSDSLQVAAFAALMHGMAAASTHGPSNVVESVPRAFGGFGAGAGGGYGGPSVRYGDEQNVLHLHGVSEPAMARVTERLLRRRDRDSNIALRRPGGYHKFGAIGGRLG